MKHQHAYGLSDVHVGQNNEWNELHFVTRETFAHMAPSVLSLEIGRLSGLIDRLPLEAELRNSLVLARFRLKALKELVSGDFLRADLDVCDGHLSAAILAVGMAPPGPAYPELDNIADRLSYVRERLGRLR